ncbi:uracil-DNA glycosylase family protein [Sphingobium rhizovicinum]|uniref:Uracil-DNA glycosylase family protein n=1 Tax=Sphingobium rhizovicinum TaxID=432308 RepID=A0ABV7NCL2_9SPHN
MRGSMQNEAALAADAYLAWWQLAGVECAVAETPVNWLRPVTIADSAPRQDAPPAQPVQARPQDLQAFHQWLESESTHPERRWPGRALYPAGQVDAPLMIVTDMPDLPDVEAGALFADRAAGALLDAMLHAIGLKRAEVYIASLFFARPPGGMVEAADLATATARMRTHVHLARPRRLLLLGDRTISALGGAIDATGDGSPHSLRNFNHDGGIVPAVATFHPRLLLGQPAAKAECWRTLQSLIEEARP